MRPWCGGCCGVAGASQLQLEGPLPVRGTLEESSGALKYSSLLFLFKKNF